LEKSKQFEYVNPNHNNDNCHYVLFREWNPETWELGPVIEVKVEKIAIASKFGVFVGNTVYPHIGAENLMFCKIVYAKNFRRGDLAVKGWNNLKNQSLAIVLSSLSINRDGVLVIVKDIRKKLREVLTEEET
jgi:hypothetical protein